MNFSYENQGHITYLTYAIAADDVVDTMSLGMITNNKIAGLAPSIFTQMDMTQFIKYNVSAKIPVQQFFSGSVKKNSVLGVFKGIVSAIMAAEDYMIDSNSIVLDLNYIFVDVSSCDISMICLPIQTGIYEAPNLNAFFKNIMFGIQTDPSENCDYVAKIINYLNVPSSFSLEDFKVLLESLISPSVNPSVQANKTESKVSSSQLETQQTSQKVKQPEVPTESNVHQERTINVQPTTIQPPVVTTPSMPTTPSYVTNTTYAPTNNQPVTPPTSLEKKKGGVFGLFSKKDKKMPEEQKQPSVQNMPTQHNSGAGFAIPGQKPPIQGNPNGFAIPGQKVPVQGNPNGFVAPTQSATAVVKPQPKKDDKVGKKASNQPNIPITQPSVQTQIPSKPMNFGETTILGGGGKIGETTVLGASSSEVQVHPHLIRTKNNEKINLDKPVFRIGKEKSYVDYFVSDNTAISRSHCNIISRDGQYFIVDTNSTNHTYVNGGMIQSNVETPLSHGAKIRLANEDFEFRLY